MATSGSANTHRFGRLSPRFRRSTSSPHLPSFSSVLNKRIVYGSGILLLIFGLPALGYVSAGYLLRNPPIGAPFLNNQGTSSVNTPPQQSSATADNTPPVSDESSDASGSSSQTSLSISSSSTSDHEDSTQVNVNGHAIPVPKQGTVHKHISSSDGQQDVDVTIHNQSSDISEDGGSSQIEINSNAFSSSEGRFRPMRMQQEDGR